MQDRRPLPVLRRETVLPPGSLDLYRDHYKALRASDGQLIRWKRLPGKGWISGVCAGLAYRFRMKPWKVRLIFVLAFAFAAIYYLLAATFVRARKRLPKDFDRRTA